MEVDGALARVREKADPLSDPMSDQGANARPGLTCPEPTEASLPPRIVVGKNGAYWRDYGDYFSMCPVSTDNDPVEIVALYVRVKP